MQSWNPTNTREIIDATTHVWKLLEAKVSHLTDEDERELARTILIEQGPGLLSISPLVDMVFDTFDNFAHSNSRVLKALTKRIIHAERFSQSHLPDHAKKRLSALRVKLSGGDFSSTVRRYTGINDWMALIDKNEESKIAGAINDLARQAAISPELLISELPWLTSTEAENSFPFGVEIGRLDKKYALLPRILDAHRVRKDRGFLGLLSGYLKVAYESDRSYWEETLDVMASDTALAPLVSETTWRTGVTETAGGRILSLATQGVVGLGDFDLWVFGAEVVNLPSEVLDQWLRYLLDHEEPRARIIGLGLFYRYYAGNPKPPPMPLDLGKQLLLHVDFFDRRQHGTMDEFYWSEVANKVIAQEPKFGVTLLEGVLKQWTSHVASFESTPNRPTGVLYKVMQDQPTKCWRAITRLIKDLKSERTFFIMKWLQGHTEFLADHPSSAFTFIKFHDVADWIDKSRKSRAKLLAEHVPKYLTGPYGSLTHAFVARYGDDPEVRKELIFNLRAESFFGDASVHFQDKRKQMEALRSHESNKNVIKFLDEYMEVLDKEIAYWRIGEERSD